MRRLGHNILQNWAVNLKVALDPSAAIIDLDEAQQISQDILFIAFPEFLRSSATFLLHKVLTRPNIFDYIVDTAFVYTFYGKMPECIKLSFGSSFSSKNW